MEGMGRLFWTLGREWIDRLIFLCLCGKIAVCNIRPRLPPYLRFLLAVPVNRINLAALECAVFQLDTLTVLV